MIRRFIDRPESMSLVKEAEDFGARAHGPKTWVILLSCVISAIAIGFLVAEVSYRDTAFSLVAFMISGVVLAGYIWFCFQAIYKRLMLTEFQSLLFANAARTNSVFCLILHRDHRIIYCDNSYFDLFAQKGVLDLERFVRESWLTSDDSERLIAAIDNGKEMRLPISAIQPDGTVLSKKYTLLVSPMDRPKGYFVLKALE